MRRRWDDRTRQCARRALCFGLIALFARALPGRCAEPELDLGPLDHALVLLKLGRRDLRVKSDYTEDAAGEGKLRLAVVVDGLRSATGSARTASDLGYRLTDTRDPAVAFETVAGLLDIGAVRAVPPPGGFHEQAPLALALAEPDKREDLDPQGPAPDPIARLPIELRQALAALVYGVARANALLARTTRELTDADEAVLRTELPAVLIEERPKAAGAVLNSLRIASRLNLREIVSAGATIAGSIGEARISLAKLAGSDQLMAGLPAGEPVIFSHQAEFGDIVVGGTGSNTHDTGAAILIDLGGDDRYTMSDSADEPLPPVRVTIDLGGDDTYEPGGSFGPSAAMLGVSALVDEAGDDLYTAKEPFSFGTAICGVGLLIDAEGSDRYLGGVCSQGAAMFGVGLLLDCAGNDIYDARLCGQGFGCVKGTGTLIDLGGNDRYRVGHSYSLTQQGEDRMLAFAQGFGFGLRDFAPGGVGILADAEGADVYVADMLCQGAAWWYGAGLLFDRAGNDEYHGSQYSQGAAGFLSVAQLIDEGGDDRYLATELAQGYARDRGIGILRDAAGDDSYMAERMAQGAAMGAGIAIAADLAGDDIYTSREEGLGFVPSGERSATVALFSDGGGQDSYRHTGDNNLCWLRGGLGAGIDLEGDLTNVRAVLPLTSGRIAFAPPLPVAPAVPWPVVGDLEDAAIEELLVEAASASDPMQRRTATRMLVRLGEKAVPYLAARMQAGDALVGKRAEAVLIQIGPPAVPELLRLMEEADPKAAQTAMVVLGKIGDPRAASRLVEQAKSPQWRTRAAAAAGMGALRGEDTRLVLAQLLGDEDEDVRRSALMALRYRGEAESGAAVSDLLGDPVFANRFAAADALVGLGVRCPPHVLSLVGSDQPEVRHLSLETCGRMATKQSLDMLISLLSSPDWGDRAFAAEALCRIGDARACDRLLEALEQERNGLVLAKASAAMKASRFCMPQQAGEPAQQR